MPQTPKFAKGRTRVIRAVIEVVFILFLFYANLLMGEFTRSNAHGKTLAFALRDILTPQNFVIALITGVIGYLVYESLHRNI